MMRASVGAVFPPRVWSPCGCARGELCAHRGGTSQVKFGSDQERAHRQSETVGTRGETHVSLLFIPLHRLNRQEFPQKKVNRIPKQHRGDMQPAARWTLVLLLLVLITQGE